MDKQTINFTANEQSLVLGSDVTEYASNTVSYIEAVFDLGNNWTGYDSVRAVWTNGYDTISTVLDADGTCIVPTEVLTRRTKVKVNLVGSISENGVLTDRLTSYPIVAVNVTDIALIDGSETAPITASQFEQFISEVGSYSTEASEAADTAVDARDDAVDAKDAAEEAEAVAVAMAEALHELNVVAETLPYNSSARADYDSETNTLAVGVPRGGALAVTDPDGDGNITITFS